MCLTYVTIAHRIYNTKEYFAYLSIAKASVNTKMGIATLVEGSRIANIVLPQQTIIIIGDHYFHLNHK